MLGSHTDPILILSISHQRHADLIANVRHDELVQAARRSRPARTPRPENLSRGRFGRITALWQTLRLAPFAHTLVYRG
jgi:hypothetical protein